MALIAAVGGAMVFPSPAAIAAPALVAIDDATPSLEQGDGSWSGAVSLTNLTDGAVSLSVAAVSPEKATCKVTLSKAAIATAQSVEAKLTVADSCRAKTDEEVELRLTATGDETQQLTVTAATESVEEPDWGQLWAFFFAFLGAAFLLLVIFSLLPGRNLGKKLEHLDAAYDFKESWVSNVTVIAGLLTGLFGSAEVVKAFLGEDADQAIALATVGAAIALVFIGSAPIMLTATRRQWVKDGELLQAFTVGGLLMATAATVAGAFGQLWVGWKSGEALDLGGWEDRIVVGFALAVALLLFSTYTVTKSTLRSGETAPRAPKPSELAELIALLKKTLQDNDDVPNEAIPKVVADVVESYPSVGTSLGDEPRRGVRRRSAML